MIRRFLAFSVAICLLLALPPVQSLATGTETENPLLMEETFAYDLGGNWSPLSGNGNGGSGWGSNWAGDKTSFTTNCPGGAKVTIPNATNDKVQIKQDAAIYRKFGTTISYQTDGEYFFESDLYAGFVGTNTTLKFEMNISDVVSCGMEDLGDGQGIRPYLTVGGSMVYVNMTCTAGSDYTLTVRISVNADGEDMVYFRCVEQDSAQTDWNVTTAASLGADLTYIGYSVPNQTSYLYVDEVRILSYPLEPIRSYDSFCQKMTAGTATEADCVSMVAALSEMPDCTLRTRMLAVVTAQAEALGINDIMENKLTGSSPLQAAHVYTEDIEEITFSYRYSLGDTTPTATIDDGTTQTTGTVSVEGGKVTVAPSTALTYNKSYTVTLGGLTDFMGNAVSANEISFTTSIVPAINITDGAEYGVGRTVTWQTYEGITAVATISINGAAAVSFDNGSVLSEMGDYVLTLSAQETEGEQKQETRSYSFRVLEALAPSVSNLRIEGTMVTGETVTAAYDFFDGNTEPEGVSLFQWYTGDSTDGVFTPITGATGKTYMLTTADEDKYLLFEVTPVAESVMNAVGTAVKSTPAPGAFKPTAENVTISGEIGLDEELSVSFTYNDVNGSGKEGEHSYTWYTKTADGEVTQVGTGDAYTIAEADYEKQIFVRVVPETTEAPTSGNPVDSPAVYAPAKPIAKDVRIEGSAQVGSTLSGYYTYYDVNGDEEAGTTAKWINTDTDATVAEGHALRLTSDMAGMSLAYVVTPQSISVPAVGAPAESAAVTVSSAGSNNSFAYSGSSSGSGGGSSGGKSTMSSTTTPVITETPAGFTDLAGHWAKDYAESLKELGLLNGVSDTEFAPDKKVSRAEFVVMMVRLSGMVQPEYQGSFSDVESTDWFSGALQAALDSGIIAEDVSFRPHAEVTRAEAAKIISVIMEKLAYRGEAEQDVTFSDAALLPEWAQAYIADAAEKGIMAGDENGAFRAQDSMTRGEAAAIMWRLHQGGISQ